MQQKAVAGVEHVMAELPVDTPVQRPDRRHEQRAVEDDLFVCRQEREFAVHVDDADLIVPDLERGAIAQRARRPLPARPG